MSGRSWIMWIVLGAVAVALVVFAGVCVTVGTEEAMAQVPAALAAVLTLMGYAAGHKSGSMGLGAPPASSSSSSSSSSSPTLRALVLGGIVTALGYGAGVGLPMLM